MNKEEEGFKKKAATGAVFLIVKRFFFQLIITGSNVFLARLLFPADFGTWAILTSIGVFFIVFSDLGMGPALIQKKEKLEDSDIQSALTVQLFLSVFVIIVMNLAASTVADYYKLGELGENLMRLYSLVFLLRPFGQIPISLLERNLNYKKLVSLEIFGVFISSLTTVGLAFLGFGVYSFVWGQIIATLIGVILMYLVFPWPIKIRFDIQRVRNLARFGFPFQSTVFLGLFFGPLILLYLGKRVGTDNLGYYLVAASLSVSTLGFSDIVNRIIFPLGSRLQQDSKFFERLVERAIVIISAMSLPIALVMLVIARQAVHFIYTDKWLPALPALYLGLVQMAIIAYSGIFSQLLLARGEAKIIRNISVFWAVLTWILGPILISKFNFVGMSLTALIVSATGIWLIFRLSKDVKFSFWSNFYPFLLSGVFASLVIWIIISRLPNQLLSLLFALVCGLVVYVTMAWLMRGKVLRAELKSLILAIVGNNNH